MYDLIIITVGVLYLGVLLVKRPEEERFFWLKVVGLVLLSFVFFDFGPLHMPLGLFIAFWIVKRKSERNRSLKYLALFFVLVYFVLTLFLPSYSLTGVEEERQKQEYIGMFTSVESVTTIPPDAALQKELQKHLRSPALGGDYHPDLTYAPILRTWILRENGIPIEDSAQIYEKWWESGVAESYTSKDDHTQILQVDFRNKHYFAVLEKKNINEPYHLVLVIRHNGFRPGAAPYFPW